MSKQIMAWLDGKLVDWMEVHVSPLSQSFSRASAIFDVMAIVPAKKGPALICLDEHVKRFFSSAERTYMSIPFSHEDIKNAIIATARANSVRNGIAKFYAYYSETDLGPKTPGKVSTAIFCLDYDTLGSDPDSFNAPRCVGISQYRKLHPQTAAVHAKVVGNYVNGFLAGTEVKRKGFDEALMLDTNGRRTYLQHLPCQGRMRGNPHQGERPSRHNQEGCHRCTQGNGTHGQRDTHPPPGPVRV
jgi:branched-chain amino acid aminotransferase